MGRTDPHVLVNNTVTVVRYQDENFRATVRPAVDPRFLLVHTMPGFVRPECVCGFWDDESIDAIDWSSQFPDPRYFVPIPDLSVPLIFLSSVYIHIHTDTTAHLQRSFGVHHTSSDSTRGTYKHTHTTD